MIDLRKLGLVALLALGLVGCDGGGGTEEDGGADAGASLEDAGAECSGSETSCDGTCADLQTDTDNCGACGTSCAAGEACMAGSCMVVCPSGTTACDNACFATANDPAHCGACDNACADGEFCVDGSCNAACPLTVCGGACVDTQVTSAHCGSCDSACAAGEACVDGACELACTADQVVCDGACVDPTSDRGYCGATADCADPGTACADGELCVDGACTVSCGTGLLACDGTCTNPLTDPSYCGASADCTGGNAGAVCATGESCVSGACTLVCPTDQIACDGACVDPTSDRLHCGASGDCTGADAGAACADGEVCASGTCAASCGAGLTLCSGACVDTDNDPAHCGDCTTVCASGANQLSACVTGTCRTACEPGFGDCDGDLSNGCETSLSDDDANCGVCGNACFAGETCVSSVCGAGHAVLMGHDFYERSADTDRLLGNAVFLSAATGTLDVLEYTELSDNSTGGEAANARAAIMERATALSRTISMTTATTSADVLTGLPSADVFVVYEQENASTADLDSRGMAWATALEDFVRRGGVVVVMDHNFGSGGTWRVLAPSGLIVVTGSTALVGSETLTVDAPTDPVAAGVTSPYGYTNGSLAYTGVSPVSVVTVSSVAAGPVVLHRRF